METAPQRGAYPDRSAPDLRHAAPGLGRAARYSEAGAAVFHLLQELDRSAAIRGAQPISQGRLEVLRVLALSGPLTMSQVARARHSSRQAVQRLAAELAQQGWIALRPNPRHRRAPLLELSPSGLAAHRRLAEAEALRLNELARGLPAAQIRAAQRILQTLRIRGTATPPSPSAPAGRGA